MKLPEIPLPGPAFMITVTHESARSRRAMTAALRFLLWMVPAGTADYVLATAPGGRHSLLLTMAASFIVLAIAVLTVNVRDGVSDAGEDAS